MASRVFIRINQDSRHRSSRNIYNFPKKTSELLVVQRNSIPKGPNQAGMTDFCSRVSSLPGSHLTSASRAFSLCTLQVEYSEMTLSGKPIKNLPVIAANLSLLNTISLSTFAEYCITCSSYICWISRLGDINARRLFKIILALA